MLSICEYPSWCTHVDMDHTFPGASSLPSIHYNDVIMSDGISNHQPHNCLLKHLFRRRSKEKSKLRVTGRCEGNSPVTSEFKENIKALHHWPLWGEFTGEFPTQMASNAENVSIWWCHHVLSIFFSWRLVRLWWKNTEIRLGFVWPLQWWFMQYDLAMDK